mmetsp:Transcript_36820/g.92270  ORF Transcript_36820/g.92270 Transcript_36820/m.92270 type:complete len:309 (-) Transcript_36820:1366-2292(-)
MLPGATTCGTIPIVPLSTTIGVSGRTDWTGRTGAPAAAGRVCRFTDTRQTKSWGLNTPTTPPTTIDRPSVLATPTSCRKKRTVRRSMRSHLRPRPPIADSIRDHRRVGSSSGSSGSDTLQLHLSPSTRHTAFSSSINLSTPQRPTPLLSTSSSSLVLNTWHRSSSSSSSMGPHTRPTPPSAMCLRAARPRSSTSTSHQGRASRADCHRRRPGPCPGIPWDIGRVSGSNSSSSNSSRHTHSPPAMHRDDTSASRITPPRSPAPSPSQAARKTPLPRSHLSTQRASSSSSISRARSIVRVRPVPFCLRAT